MNSPIGKVVPAAAGLILLALAAGGFGAKPASLRLIDRDGNPVPGGTLTLSEREGEQRAFFVVTDRDGDGVVDLVDLDGRPIADGIYRGDITDDRANPVNEGLTVTIEGVDASGLPPVPGETESVTDDGSEISPQTVALAAAGGLVLAAGGGGGGSGSQNPPNEDSTGADPPAEDPPDEAPADGPTNLIGTLNCALASDPNGLAPIVGTIGGASQATVDTTALSILTPIGAALANLAGTHDGATFAVLGSATVAATPGVQSRLTGTFAPGGGPLSGQLEVDVNGALGVAAGATAPGIVYACSGDLTATAI